MRPGGKEVGEVCTYDFCAGGGEGLRGGGRRGAGYDADVPGWEGEEGVCDGGALGSCCAGYDYDFFGCRHVGGFVDGRLLMVDC
jgi:hypothetical protein